MVGGAPARVGVWRAGSVTVAALFAIVSASACGSTARRLDDAKVQRAIERAILSEHDLHTRVVCPAMVPEQAGHVFVCSALLDVGAYPVTVTEIDGRGAVRFRDRRPLVALNIPKVERAIEASILSQRHIDATVSCPSEVLQQAGLAFRCTAMVHGSVSTHPFSVRELDNAGKVRYAGV